MPRNETITIPPGQMVELTNADVTSAITFHVHGASPVMISASATAAAPPRGTGVIYAPRYGEVGRTPADLFPGVTGATRLFAEAYGGDAVVFVSHD